MSKMFHQRPASLAPHKVLLSLPQPSLASSLFSNPYAVTGSSTDSPDVPSNCQNLIAYQAIEISDGASDVPPTFRNPWRDGSVRQTNRTKIKNPVRCEVCKIDFNSKSVLEDHISGKKHKKKMQLHNNTSNVILAGTSNVVQVQDNIVQGQESFIDAGKDLKSKKRKLLSGGEAEHLDQVNLTSTNDGIGSKKVKVTQCTRCEICMISCNTADIYITHLSGKKHLRNLKKLSKSESDSAGAGANVSVAGIAAAIVTENDNQPGAAIGSQEKPGTSGQECINSCQPANAVILEAPKKDTETKKLSKSKGDGAGADVNTAGMIAAITEENDKQPATNPAIEPQEKPGTNKQECVNLCQPENAVILEAPEKDTESKKRKHEIYGGTSITSTKVCCLSYVNNVAVFNMPACPSRCEICMINCNSKPDYIRHISGKRHKRNLEKVSKSKNDGAGASVVNAIAAIMTEIDMQPARNQAIEPPENRGTNKQECIDSCQPENAVILEAPEKESETKKRSESKSDAGAHVGITRVTAAIVTENDKQPASNRAAIESQEKRGTDKQECIDLCQPENAVILEAPEKDTETMKRSESKSDGPSAGPDVRAGITAAPVIENERQSASNPAAIESQERPDTNKRECACQPENAVILEAPEKDTETEEQKHGVEGGASITSAKFWTLSNVNNETVFNLPDCPARCEICMINCNSKPVYIRHISGKRHKRNLEKVSKSKNDGAGASVADVVSAIMPAIDVRQGTNQAIEPQEKLETSPQEGVVALKSGS